MSDSYDVYEMRKKIFQLEAERDGLAKALCDTITDTAESGGKIRDLMYEVASLKSDNAKLKAELVTVTRHKDDANRHVHEQVAEKNKLLAERVILYERIEL
tara:strand:+ start:471 stop:773 length:303 start_codon:yes stop_codon:yes gene_type:complete